MGECVSCHTVIEEALGGTYKGKCTSCLAREFGSSGLSITVGKKITKPINISLI